MLRTFITEVPDVLESHQVVVDIPRYERALARAFNRRDITDASKFLDDAAELKVITTLGQIKQFTDELVLLDKEINDTIRVPYGNYVGLQLNTVDDAVKWARRFVKRFFADTEERLIKKSLLNIPLDKTEIVWVGGSEYLPFIKAVATSPNTDLLVESTTATHANAIGKSGTLTPEEASRLRLELKNKKNLGKKNTADESPNSGSN